MGAERPTNQIIKKDVPLNENWILSKMDLEPSLSGGGPHATAAAAPGACGSAEPQASTQMH